MNIDEKRLFIKLVADGAQTKAYKRVGLTKFTIKDHLGRISEYEKDIAAADAGPSIPKKLRDIIKAKTVSSEVTQTSRRVPEPRREDTCEDSCDKPCDTDCDEGECDNA